LKVMEEKYSFIGEVHGRGLFMGVELVEEKKSKTPLSKNKCRQIFDECLKRGLLTMAYTSSFRLQPAMTIDQETLSNVADILEDVFTHFQQKGFKN
ncbi:MAG: aminotransferase class III-fold pyridoxal phosphate-dependent enzyme, partial [Pseudomonadota bacterium]